MVKFLKKLICGYDKLEEYLLCGSLVFTTLIIFAQIIMRNFKALVWSEELARYIFIWQIWLGASVAQRDNAHIRVELVFALIKNEKVKAVIDIIATLIWAAFSAFLVINGSELIKQMISRGNVSGAMRMPMYIVYLVLPLSSAVLCLRLFAHIIAKYKSVFIAGAANAAIEARDCESDGE